MDMKKDTFEKCKISHRSQTKLCINIYRISILIDPKAVNDSDRKLKLSRGEESGKERKEKDGKGWKRIGKDGKG